MEYPNGRYFGTKKIDPILSLSLSLSQLLLLYYPSSLSMRTIKNENYWPRYGAIFMANKSTREECFARKLFGLPYKFADFVMEVKVGMLLFLYDFEEKNLYGVFEAASDGAMNIIPDAYKSTSFMKFPAQVRVTTLWHCNPLPEHALHDAIKENYYDQYKFNFGLSRDQVRRLLTLFENRMIKIPSFPMEEGQDQKRSQMEKSVVVVQPCSLEISDLIKESISELQESVLGMQDSMQKSIPDKLGSLDASEFEQSADYIPVPPIEPDEIEELFEGFQWDDMSLTEVGECLMKPLIWPLEDHSSLGTDDKREVNNSTKYHVQQLDTVRLKENSTSSDTKSNIAGHKEINDSIGTEVHGMYSDSSERRSAFLRLSGLGKVMAEERHRHCDDKVDNLRGILKGLDMRRQLWDQKRSSKNVSRSALSVFSRLGSDGHARERDRRLCPVDVKHEDIQDAHQRHKRKSHDHFFRDEQKNRSRYHSENCTRTRYSRDDSWPSWDVDFTDESSVCTFSKH